MQCHYCDHESQRATAVISDYAKTCERHVAFLWSQEAQSEGITTKFPLWQPSFINPNHKVSIYG